MQPSFGRLAPARPLARSLAERVHDALRSDVAPHAVIVAALLLTSGTVALGFSVDEYFQRVALRAEPEIAGIRRAPWELYTFSAGPEHNAALMESGIFPWWTDPEFAISFLRPLSSLSLWLDHTLWPDNTALMHVHSMLWFALLLACVWRVYSALLPSRSVAVLALLLYAVDDARALTVGWISLRNALVALCPAFLALLAHHHSRSQKSVWHALLALALFALALSGGEVAVALGGYLFAYALCYERGPLRARIGSLLPYGLVLVPYRVVYTALGYGAFHSDMYIDPMREPLRYVGLLFTRIPVLLFAQFSLPPSELWEAYPTVSPWLQPAVFALVILGLGVLAWLFRPAFARSRTFRFWALGALLSTLPVCGTFPADRLLVATSLGGAAMLATLLSELFWEAPGAPASRLKRGLGYVLIAMNLGFAPLFLTVRARDIELTKNLLDTADRSIPRTAFIRDKTLIMVNPPLNALGLYFPVYRAATGLPLPRSFRYLATAESELRLKRVDSHTLELRPEGGFLFSLSQRVFRSRGLGLRVGSEVHLKDMSFRVTELTADGRPAAITVRCAKVLEDPSLLWVKWGAHEYVPFTPPRLGSVVTLPRVDAIPLLFSAPKAERHAPSH